MKANFATGTHSVPERWRAGFSLLELVIVLFIGVVLLTLLVVAIGKMRERGNRLHCANNLMQMGKAINLYDKSRLPPSRIADGYATWAVLITPYMVADSGLKNWDLERQYFDQPPSAREAVIRAYYCPARRDPPQDSVSGDVPRPGAANAPGALADYACAAGDGDPKHPWTSARANGPFVIAEVIHPAVKLATLVGVAASPVGTGSLFITAGALSASAAFLKRGGVLRRPNGRELEWRSRVRWDDLTRGKSNTILVGEKHVPADRFGEAEFGDGSIFNGANPASFSRVAGPGYGLAASPTSPFHENFGSYHPGVCQFLMADLSVRPMSVTISETVLGQLVVRD